MKKSKDSFQFVPLEVEYDPALDADDDKVFFPKKLALAHELLEKYYLPTLKNKADTSNITIDPDMAISDKPTSKKMAQAIDFFEKNGPPPVIESVEKPKTIYLEPPLTSLQKELLEFFKHDPSEEQLLQLKAFMVNLLTEKTPLESLKTEQELEKAA